MGALTSKVYTFNARPWELETISFIDTFDSFCSPIKLCIKNRVLLRVLPDAVDACGEWISDRVRFSYDSFNFSRSSAKLVGRIFGFNFRSKWVSFRKRAIHVEPVLRLLFLRVRSPKEPIFDLSDLSVSGLQFMHAAENGFYTSVNAVLFRSSFFPSYNSLFQGLPLHVAKDINFSNRSVGFPLFLVGASFRFLYPNLYIRFKKLAMSGTHFFLEVGSVTMLSNYSLGFSAANFFKFAASKTVFSRFLKPQTCFFVSYSLRDFFPAFFGRGYSIFFLPATFSALNLNEFGLSHVCFGTNAFTINFSAYSWHNASVNVDVFMYFPHIYSGKKLSTLSHRRFQIWQADGLYCKFYSFFSNFFTPASISVVDCALNCSINDKFMLVNPISFHNFFTHFSGNVHLKNSQNILLNLKRNESYRHNYFYYLRLVAFARPNFSNASISCLLDIV